MKRRRDWVERLDKFLRGLARSPFDWASHNCCVMSCDAIYEMTGVDPMAAWRGKVKTKRGAYALIKRIGGGDLCDLAVKIASNLMLEEVAPSFAQRGDVVIFPTDEGDALGIVDLSGRVIVGIHPEHGVTRVPLTRATRAWRV